MSSRTTCSNVPETDCQNAVTFFITVPVLWGTKPHQLCEGTVQVCTRIENKWVCFKMAHQSIDTAVYTAGRACIQGGGRNRQTWSELCHWWGVCVIVYACLLKNNACRLPILRLSSRQWRDIVPKVYCSFWGWGKPKWARFRLVEKFPLRIGFAIG